MADDAKGYIPPKPTGLLHARGVANEVERRPAPDSAWDEVETIGLGMGFYPGCHPDGSYPRLPARGLLSEPTSWELSPPSPRRNQDAIDAALQFLAQRQDDDGAMKALTDYIAHEEKKRKRGGQTKTSSNERAQDRIFLDCIDADELALRRRLTDEEFRAKVKKAFEADPKSFGIASASGLKAHIPRLSAARERRWVNRVPNSIYKGEYSEIIRVMLDGQNRNDWLRRQLGEAEIRWDSGADR